MGKFMRNACGNKKIATPIKSDDLFGNAVSINMPAR